MAFLVILTLICLVWYGWWLLFEEPFHSNIMASVAALSLTAIAILLARYFGMRRARQHLTQGSGLTWYQSLAAYGFLFVLSALGTINASFVIFEGTSIVRQDIDAVRSAYDHLQTEASERLRLASFEQRSAKLESELRQLKVEIDNPNGGNYCGVGRAAETILDRIRELIPDMPRIRGTGVIRPCNSFTANKVWNSYAESARYTLAQDPDYISFRGPEKQRFLSRVSEHVSIYNERLDAPGTRSHLQDALSSAASAYADDRAVYRALIKPETSNLPDSIDVSASQDLGSIAAVTNILFKRILNSRTWFYFIIAILLDLGTIYLFTHLYIYSMRNYERSAIDPYTVPGSGVRFLWVNPPKNINKRIFRRV
jgi:hypothetical protein